jgi:hypothetical protein
MGDENARNRANDHPPNKLGSQGVRETMDQTAQQAKSVKPWIWLIAAFALCFITGAWYEWSGSYQEHLKAGCPWQFFAVTAGVAIAVSSIGGIRIGPTALVVGCAFPAVILGRIALDVAEDPTNHNLWPFEVAIAFILGMVTAFPAAAIGGIPRWIAHRLIVGGRDGNDPA